MTFSFFDFDRVRHLGRKDVLPMLAWAIVFLAFFHLFAVTYVSGTSMNPTLSDGQFLISVGTATNPFIEPKRGDIVIVNSSVYGKSIIKRVIGLPGDTLQLQGGQLYLNGQLQYEPYIYEPMTVCDYNTIPTFTVPEGYYYILGDNRNHSGDSRQIGCVSADEVDYLVYTQYQSPLAVLFLITYCLLVLAGYRSLCHAESLVKAVIDPIRSNHQQKVSTNAIELHLSES